MANNKKLLPLCGAAAATSSWLATLALFGALSVGGCASPPLKKEAPAAMDEQQAQQAQTSLLIAAEMAFKNERVGEAAELYARAALTSADPQVAERATRIAVFARRYELAQQSAKRWLTLDPNALLARQALASSAIHSGDEASAFEQLQILLDGSQPAKERWQLVGQSLVGHGDSLVAKNVFVRLLELRSSGKDLDSLFAQSQLAQALGLTERANALADLAVQTHPKSERALIYRGQMKLEAQQVDAGLADYERATQILPDDRTLKIGYAALLSRYKRFAAADQVLSALPQDQDVLLARSAYADEGGDRAAALRHYRALAALKVENRADHAFALGQLAETLKLNAEALKWYAQVDLGENVGAARIRQAAVLNASSKPSEALALLKRLQTESEDPQIIESAWLLEAEMASERKDLNAEFSALDRGLAALSNSPRLLYARALKLVENKRLDDAERDFRRIIGLDPEAAYALNALGYTLADETTRYEEALGYIERALKLSPDEAAVIDSMGWVKFKLGKTDEALKYLARAHSLNQDPEISAHYGEVLIASGDREKGAEILRAAIKANPGNQRLLTTMTRLGVK